MRHLMALLWPLALGGLTMAVDGLAAARAEAQVVQGTRGCPIHVVRRGETLGTIATQYFGERERAFEIHAANSFAIGPDPDLIEVGTRLSIPCKPKPIETTQVQAPAPSGAVIAPSSPTDVLSASAPPPDAASEFYLIAGGPFAPYVDAGRPGGGLAVALMRAAFDVVPGARATLGTVDDRSAHLDVILPRGGFQISFPWVYPDCARPDLTAAEQRLCTDYVASDSLYEQMTEFYARADGPWSQTNTPDALRGATLCRPRGYPTDDLERLGLVPGGITLMRAPTPLDCLRAVDSQQVDVASMDARLTRALVAQDGLRNPLVVLEAFTHIDSLRAIARRDDPRGQAAIKSFNEGLAQLAESGQWFEIVERHFRSAPSDG